jgi:hypothetical protein
MKHRREGSVPKKVSVLPEFESPAPKSCGPEGSSRFRPDAVEAALLTTLIAKASGAPSHACFSDSCCPQLNSPPPLRTSIFRRRNFPAVLFATAFSSFLREFSTER